MGLFDNVFKQTGAALGGARGPMLSHTTELLKHNQFDARRAIAEGTAMRCAILH